MQIKYLFLLLAAMTCLTKGLSSQTTGPSRDNTLTVRGIAILKATPELLTVRVDIQAEDEKYGPCQEKLLQAIQNSQSVFISNGIDKESIRTDNMNISEKRLYIPDQPEKIVFAGQASFFIEHPYSVEYTGKLLASLRNESLAIHYILNFTLSEGQKSDLRKKAIKLALEDAREKAMAIAEGANVRLLRINSINFTDAEYGGFSIDSDLVKELDMENQVFMMTGSSNKQNPAIDFNPKEIGIKKYVTVEWVIEENR